MALKPLGDRVVVEREEAKDTTAGGIVLPDTAKDKPQKGKVVAVGDGRITKDGKRRELQVKVGEQVLFTSYAGEEFKLDGDKKGLARCARKTSWPSSADPYPASLLESRRNRVWHSSIKKPDSAGRVRERSDDVSRFVTRLALKDEYQYFLIGLSIESRNLFPSGVNHLWQPRCSNLIRMPASRCSAAWPSWPVRSR